MNTINKCKDNIYTLFFPVLCTNAYQSRHCNFQRNFNPLRMLVRWSLASFYGEASTYWYMILYVRCLFPLIAFTPWCCVWCLCISVISTQKLSPRRSRSCINLTAEHRKKGRIVSHVVVNLKKLLGVMGKHIRYSTLWQPGKFCICDLSGH